MQTDTEKKWFALEVTIDSEASEAIEFGLNELDSLGTEIDSLGKAKTETICVVGYFNEKPEDEILREKLSEALKIYNFSSAALKKTEWREVANADWLAEWKKHWKPTETEKFVVAPNWINVENTGKITVTIEPNMAFGTGTHETTRLCLKAIETNYESGMSFFDVGTGTGILAIAAAKLKFKAAESEASTVNLEPETLNSITGCDTDEDSIKIAKENAGLNGVGEKISFYVGSISEDAPEFDFVCANLTADVIVPLLPLLIRKSRQVIILSGILKEQESLIVGELSKFQISNFKVETDGEWISIKVKKEK